MHLLPCFIRTMFPGLYPSLGPVSCLSSRLPLFSPFFSFSQRPPSALFSVLSFLPAALCSSLRSFLPLSSRFPLFSPFFPSSQQPLLSSPFFSSSQRPLSALFSVLSLFPAAALCLPLRSFLPPSGRFPLSSPLFPSSQRQPSALFSVLSFFPQQPSALFSALSFLPAAALLAVAYFRAAIYPHQNIWQTAFSGTAICRPDIFYR